jgi:predicted transport protein
MAKTSGELEKEFIEAAKDKTGKSLQEWLKLVKSAGIEKRNDIIEWLRKGHGLNHLQATFITGIYLNNGNPVYMNENALLENQFLKCPEIRPLFENISEKIISSFQGTQLIPKKTYLSFTAIREFAAINVKPKEIRLGIDLGSEPFTATLQKSKLTGPMPRISHMLTITDEKQFDKNVMELLSQSYKRTHSKS